MPQNLQEQVNLRLPNYELLRIFSILVISFMHGIRGCYGHSAVFVCVNIIGNMGVSLFVLISGYFGIRLRASKVLWLWVTMLFYSIFIFVIQYYLDEIPTLENGDDIKDFMKHLYVVLTPVTSNTWWFCTSYIILMLLSPLFNKASISMSKLQFQYLIAILLLIFSLSPTFLHHPLSGIMNGKCTENMILLYFIGRYFAKFGIPLTIRKFAVFFFIICVTLIFCVNFFLFDPLFMAKDNNFFIILGAICIFFYFGVLRVQSDTAANIIRYIASMVFPFYLMNVFLIDHFEHQYYNLNGFDYFISFLITQAEILSITFAIESIRRFLMILLIKKPSHYFDKKVERLKQKSVYGVYLSFFYTPKSNERS